MNCTTIVETASRSANNLHLRAYFAAQKYARDHRYARPFLTKISTFATTQQPACYALFENLPCEILTMVLDVLDLKSLWALASTSRHLRSSTLSLPVLRVTQECYIVSYALRRLIAIDVGNTFTVVEFQNVLTSKACISCRRENEFATLLDLATCERLCLSCSNIRFEPDPTQLVELPFLACSNGVFQFQGARECEGCLRDDFWNPAMRGELHPRAEKAYLEDQFLEHFSRCETAWKIASGQRMTRYDEWILIADLEREYVKAWDTTTARDTLPARDFRVAVHQLRFHKELAAPAFQAEYVRLKRIAREAIAQQIREGETTKDVDRDIRNRRRYHASLDAAVLKLKSGKDISKSRLFLQTGRPDQHISLYSGGSAGSGESAVSDGSMDCGVSVGSWETVDSEEDVGSGEAASSGKNRGPGQSEVYSTFVWMSLAILCYITVARLIK